MTRPAAPGTKASVAIIGAGRLGQALALTLQSCGHPIVALVAQSRPKAEKVARLLGDAKGPRKLAASQLAELPLADLIVIATPDDAIAETARKLGALFRGDGRRTALHTSGALSSEALASMAEVGFQTGSLHPLVSISEPVSGAQALRGAFFCIEGTTKAKGLARSIVRDLDGYSFTIKPEKKALYHAAAVMASPHLTTLFDLATELLAACGLSRSDAQKVFLPLLESTVNNLKTASSQKALTGTFARGDVATVRRHLEALSGKEFAGAREVYKLLGLHALAMAERNGLDPKVVKQIRREVRVKSEK